MDKDIVIFEYRGERIKIARDMVRDIHESKPCNVKPKATTILEFSGRPIYNGDKEMFDVKIINNEAILFEDDIEINIESYRKNGDIRYVFDGGSHVEIWSNNAISWYDSDGWNHRDGDMPAYINTGGYLLYYNHGKWHRVDGPAVILSNGREEYWLDGIRYTKEEYDTEMATRNA